MGKLPLFSTHESPRSLHLHVRHAAQPSCLSHVAPRRPVVTEAVCSASGIMELRQHFSDWAFLTVRLLPGERAVVVDWTIGAIPLGEAIHTCTQPFLLPPTQPDVCYAQRSLIR